MATREELEALPTPDLYDRATKHALRHADIRFFWRVLEALPAAEAAAGHLAEGETDVQSIYGHLNDLKTAREGDVADELRAMYIDYLLEHGG
ncbi:MAG: hypothetical protein ACJ77Z_16665 [Thermoleophilaceae bacterium]